VIVENGIRLILVCPQERGNSMKIRKGTRVEIHLYATPLEDMDFLMFTEDLHEKYPYWKFQNESYRELPTGEETK
jgi:hypothetical protein